MTADLRTQPITPLIRVLSAALMIWVVVVVTLSQVQMSPTFDEQNHVTRGIAILRTGDYRLCFHHPPLANIVEGLPVAWLESGFSVDMPAWKPGEDNSQFLSIWSAAHQTIWQQPQQGVTLITLARFPVLLFTLLLGWVIFAWSRELFGPWGGVLSLALFAFDPTVLAHSGLATTDIPAACTILLAMYWLRKYLYQPQRRTLLLAGAGIGLALATKFSALILLPILAVILLIFTVRAPQLPDSLPAQWQALSWIKRFGRAVGHGVLLLFIGGIVVWGVYAFKVEGLGSKPGIPLAANASLAARLPVPAMQYLRGVRAVSSEAEGHRAYLLGQADTTGKGWWYYFPVAIATKTPLPALILIIGAVALVCVPRLRPRLTLPRRELVLLLVPVVIFLLAALGLFGISLNLGIRHALPIYPFLYILVGGFAALRISSRAYRPALVILLAAQAASVLWAYPNFIAYFNEAAELRGDGSRILIDSNYDWGQDLAQLARVQRERKLYPLAFSYFGTTPPEAYGIVYTPLAGFGLMSGAPGLDVQRLDGYLAISVTNLLGGEGYTGVDYRLLPRMTPVARAGKTILIYRFSR